MIVSLLILSTPLGLSRTLTGSFRPGVSLCALPGRCLPGVSGRPLCVGPVPFRKLSVGSLPGVVVPVGVLLDVPLIRIVLPPIGPPLLVGVVPGVDLPPILGAKGPLNPPLLPTVLSPMDLISLLTLRTLEIGLTS